MSACTIAGVEAESDTCEEVMTEPGIAAHCCTCRHGDSPVVHDRKLAVWGVHVQQSLRLEPLQGHAFVEVAVV